MISFCTLRHALERHLEAEIAARHHHRVGGAEDRVDVVDRGRALDLGDERRAPVARLGDDRARHAQVLGGLHEAERHEVDALRQAEAQVGDVLRRQRRGRQRHARQVDALLLAERPAADDRRRRGLAVGRLDAQLDAPVVEQQLVARPHRLGQAGEGRRDPPGAADEVAGRDLQRRAGDEVDRLAVHQSPGADLRPGQILEDGDVPPRPRGRGADAGDDGAVLRVGAVREVQPEDVRAGGDEGVERAFGGAGRAHGGDDLGESAHGGMSKLGSGTRLPSRSRMLPEWFDTARADAERRGLSHIVPVLEALRASGERLRQAQWADQATARIALGGATLAPAAIAPPPDPAAAATRPAAPLPTIAETAAFLRSGDLTASALADATLDAIARDNGRLNAFITVTTDRARADAAAADADLRTGVDRGPLQGIPISIKDLIDVAGYATTAASRVRQFDRASTDAAVVTRLREAGAVIIGKTNLHEFALGPTSEESAYGPPRHPLDPTRLPGGSSGGSAAAVAAGLGFASVGTDTGCSVRIPAALCGIVGLKPRFGDVSTDGVLPLSRRLDHVGPLARSVADARLLYQVMAGRPVLDDALRPDLASLSAGIVTAAFASRLDDGVRGAIDAALERLRAAGLTTQPAPLGVLDDAAAAYLPICLADAAALHAQTLETQASDYSPGVRARLEAGRYVAAEDYARATQAQAVMRQAVDRALGRCDVLILATAPTTAPLIGATTVTFRDGTEPIRNALLRLCQPFNLTRHPAITIPVPPLAGGLPVGLQLVASDTERLLEIALAVEAALA